MMLQGGLRGLPPILGVLRGSALYTVRVLDTDDLIDDCLSEGKFREALELALSDTTALRRHSTQQLVGLCVQSLIEKYRHGERDENSISQEVSVLLGRDSGLWTHWIDKFVDGELFFLLTAVPVMNPRLDTAQYQRVIDLLLDADPLHLLATVRKWSQISPPLIDRGRLITSLENHCNKKINRIEQNKVIDTFLYLECLSLLYLASRQYAEALDCFFRIEELLTTHQNFIGSGALPSSIDLKERDCRRIFELIEQQGLFGVVANRILALVRVSRELTLDFLVRNIHIFPVLNVVAQLASEKEIMIGYLNALMEHVPDRYNSAEYSSIHSIHFSSLIESPSNRSSEILRFLEYSQHVDTVRALRMCLDHVPPLTKASIHILAKAERYTEALSLLLEQGGSARECVDFVIENGRDLWSIVVEYALHRPHFLSALLEEIGDHSLAAELIEKLPPESLNHEIRQGVLRLLRQIHEKVRNRLA